MPHKSTSQSRARAIAILKDLGFEQRPGRWNSALDTYMVNDKLHLQCYIGITGLLTWVLEDGYTCKSKAQKITA